MAEYIQVFSTVEKKEDAHRITKMVVEKRLAACAQIIGPITSTFWWKERLEEEEEWLLVMKTRDDLYAELEKAIKEDHPYEVPEILAVPVIEGNKSYLEWIEKEVGDIDQ